MAIYDPIVPRPNDGAGLPDALRRARYQQMLSEELGRRPEGFTPAEPERGWRGLIAPIVAMLLLATIVLAGFFVFTLWKSGAIGWRLPEGGPTAAQRNWQYQDRARPLEEPEAAPSEIDRILEERRKPAEEKVEEVAGEVEE